jgi:tRNA (cmo5U34)-methyltransferase
MSRRDLHLAGAEWKESDRAGAWPSLRQTLPHITNAEQMLIEHLIPGPVDRILDLGTGDGYLIALLRRRWPSANAVGLDLSPHSR